MTEETESPVLDIPKRLQSEFGLMRQDIAGIRAEVTSPKQHMAGFISYELARDSDVASHKHRVERTERRLDLID